MRRRHAAAPPLEPAARCACPGVAARRQAAGLLHAGRPDLLLGPARGGAAGGARVVWGGALAGGAGRGRAECSRVGRGGVCTGFPELWVICCCVSLEGRSATGCVVEQGRPPPLLARRAPSLGGATLRAAACAPTAAPPTTPPPAAASPRWPTPPTAPSCWREAAASERAYQRCGSWVANGRLAGWPREELLPDRAGGVNATRQPWMLFAGGRARYASPGLRPACLLSRPWRPARPPLLPGMCVCTTWRSASCCAASRSATTRAWMACWTSSTPSEGWGWGGGGGATNAQRGPPAEAASAGRGYFLAARCSWGSKGARLAV